MADNSKKPYPGKGNLFSALADFKTAYVKGQMDSWPKYWREFADQAFADILAYECLLREAGVKIPKPDKRQGEN